jgi:hypothetical protein
MSQRDTETEVLERADEQTPDNPGATDTTLEAQEGGEGGGDEDDEEVEVEQLEPFSLGNITNENVGEVAKAIVARIQGKKFSDRFDTIQELFGAIRDERDLTKTTRAKKSLAQIVEEIQGKSLGDLQTIKVELPKTGLTLSVSQIARLADESQKASPMHKPALKFFEENKLKLVEEKKSSKGKASMVIRHVDYVPPTKEGEGEADQKAA